jgi:hypothetical protein
MSKRKQGFDPLSSLFEVPDPAMGVPLGDLDLPEEITGSTISGRVGLTDPHFRTPHDLSLPPSRMEVPVGELEEEDAPTESMTPEAPDAMDPVAIAKAVGKAAAARAMTPTKGPVSVRRSSIDREAAEDAAISILSEKASTRRQMDAGAVLNELPIPSEDEPLAPRYGVKRTRAEAMAARARAPVNALEAARVAAQREDEQRTQQVAEEARSQEQQLSDRIQEMIPRLLPNAGAIYVANALRVEQRRVLRAIWRSHRSHFMAGGQLERAVGAAAVLHALESVSEQGLVVAHVVTDASDYLLWMDLDQDTVLAAFSDARAYFAG